MKTLEKKELNYIIACRFNNRIKHQLVYERKWANVAPGLDIAEGTYQGLD